MKNHFKKYTIGIREKNGSFKYFKPPFYEFWADPFIVEENGKVYLFFEVLNYFTNKGHISYAKYNPISKKISKVQIILKEKHHLSYPQVFKYKNTYYLIPETMLTNTVSLYEFSKFPTKVEFKKNLLENVLNVDSTLFIKDGVFYLFTNPRSDMSQKQAEELDIYYSKSLHEEFTKIKNTSIEKNDVANARMAGNILILNEKLFRVSQNCEKIYGEHMSLNEINVISKDEYVEVFNGKFELGIKNPHHTYNSSENFEVIDVVKYTSLVFVLFTLFYRLPIMTVKKVIKIIFKR